MKIEDLKIISKLIHTYGIKEFEKIAEMNSAFLNYMISKDSNIQSKYCETDSNQIFTNGKSSIFCLNNITIDFDLLKTDTNMPVSLNITSDEMDKYLDNSKKLFGENGVKVTAFLTGSHTGMAFGIEQGNFKPNQIDLQDLKMIRLLLKNYNIYASINEQIFHIEGDNGYAYVLDNNPFN